MMSALASRRRLNRLRAEIERELMKEVRRSRPREIRKALQYVIGAGGKRVRGLLVLLSCEAVGGRPRNAVHAAAAVELLHGFTLVHDDIMDHAPTRRGKITVHERWGLSSGILSGDVLLGLAYDSLLRTGKPVEPLMNLLTRGLLDVCEGQAVDLRFEGARKVSLAAYFRMIERKTSALIATSSKLGGFIGSGSPSRISALGTYGLHLGRAFQVQDDLLDVVADERTFGKIVGGDIVSGKKTYLLLEALRRAKGKDRTVLLRVINLRNKGRSRNLVKQVRAVYDKLGVPEAARKRIHRETELATASLRTFPENNGTGMLRWIASALQNRMF